MAKIDLPVPFTACDVDPENPTGYKPSKFDLLCADLGLSTEHGRVALSYALRCVMLLDKKQQDYGPRNISDFGLQGVVIRLNDKLQRVINLTGKSRRKARNESLFDAFQDITNYGIIAQMLEKDEWPT